MNALFFVNTLLFGLLFVAWSRQGWFNLAIKAILFFALVGNVVAVLK